MYTQLQPYGPAPEFCGRLVETVPPCTTCIAVARAGSPGARRPWPTWDRDWLHNEVTVAIHRRRGDQLTREIIILCTHEPRGARRPRQQRCEAGGGVRRREVGVAETRRVLAGLRRDHSAGGYKQCEPYDAASSLPDGGAAPVPVGGGSRSHRGRRAWRQDGSRGLRPSSPTGDWSTGVDGAGVAEAHTPGSPSNPGRRLGHRR
jgi:hypothetical protein